MGGESRQVVNLDVLIKELIDRIESIDCDNDIDRSQKTKLTARAATRFINDVYGDKRRSAHIALSTFRKYLTIARREVTAKNWRHHSFEAQIQRLCKRYPAYADRITDMAELHDITELRLCHRDLLRSLRNDEKAYSDIKAMKIDHEVMRHLVMPDANKDQLSEDAEQALEAKKRNTININYLEFIKTTTELITCKTKVSGGQSMFAYGYLSLGIAMATGRRFIEVVKLGRFKKTGEFTLEFSGQAKKRGGVDYSETYEIYTTVKAQLCIDAISQLRDLPEIHALDQYSKLGYVKSNDKISKRCAKTANEAAKKTFGRDDAVFKDSRAMWARIVFERHFKSDPKWAKKDEDIFWQEMLGHDDMETQKSYKGFKVNYDDIDVNDDDEPPVTRHEAVMALDNLDAINHRKAMLKLHRWVKETITHDPQAKITQSLITRELGSSRLVISDYMKIAKNALNMPASIVEVPKDIAPIKPRIHCHKIGNIWEAVATVKEHEIAKVQVEGSRGDAIRQIFKIISE